MITRIARITTTAALLQLPLLFVASSSSTIIDQFDGRVGEESSWFDSTLWSQSGEVPTSEDVVWIDESDAYVAIDDPLRSAEVAELVVGRSATSHSLSSVQLDVLEGATLEVAQKMIVGQHDDSDGLVYALSGSEISVGSTLYVGMDGNGGGGRGRGLVVLNGDAKLLATGLEIRSEGGNAVLLDDDAVIEIVGKDRVAALQTMAAIGSVKPLNNNNGDDNKAIKVSTKNGNTVLAVVNANSPAPSASPSSSPTLSPSENHSASPTLSSSASPSSSPTLSPSENHSASPTLSSSASPSGSPSSSSSSSPTSSLSENPSASPSSSPSASPSGSFFPSAAPSDGPTVTSKPSAAPTKKPFVCKNTKKNVKYVQNGKTKKVKCRKVKKKKHCDKEDKNGVPVWRSCPVKCKKCNKLEKEATEKQEAAEEEDDVTTSNNQDNRNRNHNIFCKDSNDLQYNNEQVKDCAWVKESKLKGQKTCDLEWLGQTLAQHCPKACNRCLFQSA